MGGSLTYKGNRDVLVSNGTCDFFCEIVVEVAKLEGKDISAVFQDAPGIAGCYGVSGVGVYLEDFLPYFDNDEQQFLRHLAVCRDRINEVCDTTDVASNMTSVIRWVEYVISGGIIDGEPDFYTELPPS